jgi:ligand-binding sensor domain-containing protein
MKTCLLYITIFIISLSTAHLYAGKNIGIGELTIYDTFNSQLLDSMKFFLTITTDNSGKIWAGSFQGGLGVFDGVTWKVFTNQNSSLLNNTIRAIAIDYNNVAWIGSDSGLVKYDGTTWTVFTPKNSPMKLSWITAVAIDKNNNVWFGNGNCCDGGLMCLSGDEWKLFTPENSNLPDRIIMDILVDSSKSIWVGTTYGLVRITDNSWIGYNKNNSIMPYNWVDNLALDKQGTIWAGQSMYYSSDFNAGALMTIAQDGSTWSLNDPSQTGKASKNVQAIACDKRGYMWVSTSWNLNINHDVVSVFNKKRWISFTLCKDDTSFPYFIRDITVDKNNNVWFATEEGILMLKQDTAAIDSLFVKEGVGIKNNFKPPALLPKGKMVFCDLLGRKCSRLGNVFKKSNGVILGFDNLRVKKIAIVK